MANQSASTAIFIDKYHPKNTGLCAISIRVTYDRKKKYYPTPISLTVEDFEKTKSEKPRGAIKEYALKLQAFEKRAADIIRELPVFTWIAFEKYYLTNRTAKNTLESAYTAMAKELREDGRIGNAVAFECSQGSLNKFAPGAKFADVTPSFLHNYERWMVKEQKSITTVGIYLRCLRTLFNNAVSDGMLNKDLYPFGKKKYEIPTSNNIKKALTLTDIASIYYYKPIAGSTAEMAKDYWLFLYLCNGMNIKDMCLLKYENIKGDVIEFERAKTVRTKRNVEAIRVSLVEDVQAIIKKWGNIQKDGSMYIFPVLQKGLTPERERQLIQQLTHVVNHHMKAIAASLNISADVTTYAARHSFATILQRSGASIAFIGEALGHSSSKTTQNYLAGFEDESKREVVKALTAFKQPAVAI